MPSSLELINEVYIVPIKSVLFIDDKFPTYADALHNSHEEETSLDLEQLKIDEIELNQNLFTAQAPKNTLGNEEKIYLLETNPSTLNTEVNSTLPPDTRRALTLTQSCRECGYIFDVEKSAQTALQFEDKSSFINKADLVVLDFILDEATGSSAEALKIIDKLNNTSRFNLVIVYTNNDPIEVGREIAYFLRGKNANDLAAIENIEIAKIFSDEHILEYVDGYLTGKKQNFSPLFPDSNLDDALYNDICGIIEIYLQSHFSHIIYRKESSLLDYGNFKSETPWICGRAVFITVARKGFEEVTISTFLEKIANCLNQYAPSPISMLIHKSVNTLKEGGDELLEKAFGQPSTRAALLYRTLSVEDHKFDFRLADLMTRAFSKLSSGIQEKMSEFGTNLLDVCAQACDGQDTLTVASSLEKVTDFDQTMMYLNINAYLCSQQIETSYITTGTVFRRKDNTKESWICVTPACDMVPSRRIKEGIDYRNLISPANYFEAMRITEDTNINKALKNAHKSCHIFIEVDDTIKAYKILHDDQQIPKNYIFFCKDSGNIINGTTSVHIVDIKHEDDDEQFSFVCNQYEIEIIGQLRPNYASRFLAIKGDWNSRIGVDFIAIKGG